MIARVQRTRMRPDGFYPAVAFNRRIPKLARMGKFGSSGFFFHRARRILFRQDEKEWGVQTPQRKSALKHTAYDIKQTR